MPGIDRSLSDCRYDWERDARAKVDDCVEFPDVLDVAQFFDLDAGAEER